MVAPTKAHGHVCGVIDACVRVCVRARVRVFVCDCVSVHCRKRVMVGDKHLGWR